MSCPMKGDTVEQARVTMRVMWPIIQTDNEGQGKLKSWQNVYGSKDNGMGLKSKKKLKRRVCIGPRCYCRLIGVHNALGQVEDVLDHLHHNFILEGLQVLTFLKFVHHSPKAFVIACQGFSMLLQQLLVRSGPVRMKENVCKTIPPPTLPSCLT